MNWKIIVTTLLCAFSLTAAAQRIAVLSDVHVSPGSATEGALLEAVDEINATPFDLVVMNGDLTNLGTDSELANMKGILDKIEHPLFVVPGNHETTWSQSATKTFKDLWDDDKFVTVEDSLVIVGLNCGPFMKMGNGYTKKEDLRWLRQVLDSVAVGGRRVLSFNHYPLNSDLDNTQEYIELLEGYPVIAQVGGHYHAWKTYIAGHDKSGSDLPCFLVRALNGGNGDYGYTEIEIDPQWIHVYNKTIGEPRKAKFAFANNDRHTKARFEPKPELVVPDGFEVEKVWDDGASIFTRLGFDADNIYFGNSLGHAMAIDKESHEPRWSVNTGASLFSRPVSLGKNVAVPAHDGILIIDAATGKVVRTHLSEEGPYVADGTLTPDGKEYLQGGFKRFEKRRAKDGKLIWSYDSIFNYCQAAPAVDGNDVVFGAWDTNLRMLDLKTGKLRWSWDNGNKNNDFIGPGNVVPVLTDDKVIIVAPDRYMTAIDRATGRQLWRDRSHRYRESLGHSADFSRVYSKTMDGELVAVDATSPEFKELWTIDLGLGYEHAPCEIIEKDGYVYTGSLKGRVTITRADGPELVASLPLGMSEINGIDVDPYSGDVYVSLVEGTVFRIKKK